MAIKVLIKRKIKDGQLQAARKLLLNARYKAVDHEGYISSETLRDATDPNKIVVVSMWQKMENWKAWKASEARKANEEQFEALLDGPTEYDIYFLGLPTT